MKVKNSLTYIFYGLYFLLIIPIIAIAILQPENNMITGQIIVLVVLASSAIAAMSFVWNSLYKKIRKAEPYIYVSFLILFGVLMFVFLKNQTLKLTHSFDDYSYVYYTAEELSQGEIQSSYYYDYFSKYDNNTAPMIILSWLFAIAGFFHISKELFALAIVCIQVVLTVRAIGYLLETKEEKTWRLPSAVALAVFFPVWWFSAVFYTDTMSFGLSIIAIALLKHVFEEDTQRTKVLIKIIEIFAAAILIAFAMKWKITGVIPMIGIAIAYALNNKKINFKYIIVLTVALMASYLTLTLAIGSYQIKKEAADTSDPIISWVALGMKEEGTWAANRDFAEKLHTLTGKDEKKQFSYEYISDNWRNAFAVSHLFKKAKSNFADGNLNFKSFMIVQDDDSVYWDLYNPWGKYFWRVSQYDSAYLFSMYIFLFAGGILNFVKLIKKKEISVVSLGSHLSFVGIVIFLMIWEANSRQLYNQMPMLIIGEFFFLKEGTSIIEDLIDKKKDSNRKLKIKR